MFLLMTVQDSKAENPNGQRSGRETRATSVTETELESEGDAKDVQDTGTKRKFMKEELEFARRVYYEHRQYVPITPGMSNQIYRNGFLSKKTLDGDGYTCMQGSKNYYREYVPFILS
jgi:hypothetical protein